MDYIIKQRLDNIERTAQQIKCDVQGIYGYCDGMAAVAEDFLMRQKNKKSVETLPLQSSEGQMDEFIKRRFDTIEQMAEEIQCLVREIYGYCNGMETAAKYYPRKEEIYATTGQINGLIVKNN